MSLINQMLKDLDARHEADTRGRLHREIRALPRDTGNRPLRLGIIGLLLLALLAGGWWAYERMESLGIGRTLPDLPVAASPPAADPVPAAPAPAPSASPAPPAVANEAPANTAVPVVAPGVTEPDSKVALDEASGMKLSAMLDRMPTSVPISVPTSVPTSVPNESKPPAAAPKRPPPVAAPDTAGAAKNTKPEMPSSAARGSVDKLPSSGKSSRERSEADYRRAVALVNGARSNEATDLLLDILRQDGGHVASRQLLARLLIEQRRYDEASAILIEGLSTQPGQVAWAMTLARLQVERGDLAGAARTLQTSQPFAAANADYLGFAGLVQYRLGHPKESVDFYQAAARVAPSEGRWWMGLGLALEADRRPADAREAFVRARAAGTLNADLAALVDQKLR